MPLLPSETATFLRRVTDSLRFGQSVGGRASVTLASTVAGGIVTVTAARPGAHANAWTIAVTEPAGTTPLTVTRSGNAITVALGVTAGSATATANTMTKIAAAINVALPDCDARVTTASANEVTNPIAAATFSGGSDSANGEAAPSGGGYLRAQDLAAFFKILQDACGKASVTATGGSTTTAVVASIPNAGQYVGAKVTFAAATTTAALRDQVAYVASHNATTFTFSSTLPAACANTDTFAIELQLVTPEIAALYQDASKTYGDAPSGNVYGETRQALDAIAKLIEQMGGGAAVPTRLLTRAGVVTAADSTDTLIESVDAMRVDEFKGRDILIASQVRRIVGNTDTTIRLAKALTSAPAGGVSFQIVEATLDYRPGVSNLANTHPGGGHPNNAWTAYLLEQAQAAVEALILPA